MGHLFLRTCRLPPNRLRYSFEKKSSLVMLTIVEKNFPKGRFF